MSRFSAFGEKARGGASVPLPLPIALQSVFSEIPSGRAAALPGSRAKTVENIQKGLLKMDAYQLLLAQSAARSKDIHRTVICRHRSPDLRRGSVVSLRLTEREYNALAVLAADLPGHPPISTVARDALIAGLYYCFPTLLQAASGLPQDPTEKPEN